MARLDLWLAQMLPDARSGDAAAVRGDFFAVDYVRDRIRPHLREESKAGLDTGLEELLDAFNEGDLAAVTELAGALREQVAAGVF